MTSLTIKRLELANFRNYKRLKIENISPLMIIVGDNAMGKTNIIEAIQLLTEIESFRKPKAEELIKNGEQIAQIEIEVTSEQRLLKIKTTIEENRYSYQINGKKVKKSALRGQLPAVLFTPDDLQLVKGASSKRRDLVDDLASQISNTFSIIRQDYTRLIYQKNRLLKSENINALVLDSWNANLAKLGASYFLHRQRLFNRLVEETKNIYQKLAPGEYLETNYIPSWEREEQKETKSATALRKEYEELTKEKIQSKLLQTMEAVVASEYRQQRSLIGPHRDEIDFYINGKNSRRFASQGQQRSLALALRIAAIAVLRDTLGKQPILLLDDVMSELDTNRRKMLLEVISENGQTFISTTNLGYFDKDTQKKAQIVSLPFYEMS